MLRRSAAGVRAWSGVRGAWSRFSWWFLAARHRCICTWKVSHRRCSGAASSAILERRPAPLYTKAPFSRSDIRLGNSQRLRSPRTGKLPRGGVNNMEHNGRCRPRVGVVHVIIKLAQRRSRELKLGAAICGGRGGSRRCRSRSLPRARSAPPQLEGAAGFGSSCGAPAGGEGAQTTPSLRPPPVPARPPGSLTAQLRLASRTHWKRRRTPPARRCPVPESRAHSTMLRPHRAAPSPRHSHHAA